MSGARNVARAAARRAYGRWRREPLREAVLLEAFEGTSVGCNPGAIAEYLLNRTDLPLVWALRDPVPFEHPRIRSVRYRSAAYYRALATTRYLVNNVTFPPLFDKRDDQVYLNSWHGTPLKRMGRDVGTAHGRIANTVANFEVADILLSSGGYMTNTMYAGAYGVATDHVLEAGSPRVDVQFPADPDPDLVLYAPTWQEASYTKARNDLDEVAARMAAIAAAVPAGSRAVLRVHHKLALRAAGDPRLQPYLVPPEVTTNALLRRCHTLVTDYSSVAFDFLATGSQVLFFTPAQYPRGVYLADHALPGPRTSELSTVQSWLSGGLPPAPLPLTDARALYCPHEDGRATARAVAAMLER